MGKNNGLTKMSLESWKLYIVGLPSRVYYYNILFLSDSQAMYIYCTLYMHDIVLCAIKVKSWTSSDVRAAAKKKKSRGQQHFCQECTIVVHCPPSVAKWCKNLIGWDGPIGELCISGGLTIKNEADDLKSLHGMAEIAQVGKRRATSPHI